VDAEKIARYARLDPEILRPIAHRTVAQQETLTLIRARDVLVRLRTAAVNSVRGLAKPCGYRLPASSTLTFPKRCQAVLPPGLGEVMLPVLSRPRLGPNPVRSHRDSGSSQQFNLLL